VRIIPSNRYLGFWIGCEFVVPFYGDVRKLVSSFSLAVLDPSFLLSILMVCLLVIVWWVLYVCNFVRWHCVVYCFFVWFFPNVLFLNWFSSFISLATGCLLSCKCNTIYVAICVAILLYVGILLSVVCKCNFMYVAIVISCMLPFFSWFWSSFFSCKLNALYVAILYDGTGLPG